VRIGVARDSAFRFIIQAIWICWHELWRDLVFSRRSPLSNARLAVLYRGFIRKLHLPALGAPGTMQAAIRQHITA